MKFRIFHYKIFRSSRRVAKRPFRIEDIHDIFKRVPKKIIKVDDSMEYHYKLLKTSEEAISYFLLQEIYKCNDTSEHNSVPVISANSPKHKYALRTDHFFIAADLLI